MSARKDPRPHHRTDVSEQRDRAARRHCTERNRLGPRSIHTVEPRRGDREKKELARGSGISGRRFPRSSRVEQRLQLTRAFSRELADRYNVAVDMTIHAPREGGDPRAHHAHLLTTTREVTHRRTGTQVSHGDQRNTQVGPRSAALPARVQSRPGALGDLTNQALREAHIEARIDHRSLAAQGIDREPGPSIPHRFIAMERQGIRVTVAEQIRENYHQRVQSRAARTLQNTHESVKGDSLEEVRDRAAQAWLQYREKHEAADASPEASARAWLQYREKHEAADPSPEASARAWLEYREKHEAADRRRKRPREPGWNTTRSTKRPLIGDPRSKPPNAPPKGRATTTTRFE